MPPAHLYRSEAFAEDLEPASVLPRSPVARDAADRTAVRAWTVAVTQAWRQGMRALHAGVLGAAAGRSPRGLDWRADAGAANARAGAGRSAR